MSFDLHDIAPPHVGAHHFNSAVSLGEQATGRLQHARGTPGVIKLLLPCFFRSLESGSSKGYLDLLNRTSLAYLALNWCLCSCLTVYLPAKLPTYIIMHGWPCLSNQAMYGALPICCLGTYSWN